ncbi:hypothetical protein [Paracoccus sp. DMF]|uniref:restriction endonuclease subunit S n=1 Tax=Paracoccus sp. DMF TaxID=400837 RepID=UPI00110351FE|nr:hypothetical protein [Paracoccus sp. DMF]MCV2447498.1 hypothetical protein [Paracoccus sp. DMF]
MTARALTLAPSAECGGLAPYASYRDSGLPWLGAIPSHWDVRRNGRLFAERVETGFEDLPILEVSLRTGVRVRDMENGARKQQMADRSKYKRAAKGDIAYNMMRMWQGAVGVAPEDGLISPAYVVARPFPGVDPRYFTYLFRTSAYTREVNKFSRGIVSDRNRLYWDEFKQMPSAFPPTGEQARIAEYLDAHGRRTARLIRNKRRLIGLLNEQRQAIINRAVTRGLNPAAPMKPTGIDWMPEVPVHWEVKRIKNVVREKDTRSGTGQHELLSLTRKHGLVRHSDVASRPASAADFTNYKVCLPGEIVMNRMQAWSGMFGLASEEGMVSPDYAVFVPTGDCDAEYLATLFKTPIFVQQFAIRSQGIGDGFNRLYTPTMGGISIVAPGIIEQRQILEHIEDETHELSQLQIRLESETALIREYRERLIADVVTGKLDVRHIEIVAPADEPAIDEDDALDEDLDAEGTDELAEDED